MTKEEKKKRLNDFVNSLPYSEMNYTVDRVVKALDITRNVFYNWIYGRTEIPEHIIIWFDDFFDKDIFFDRKKQERKQFYTNELIVVNDKLTDYVCKNCRLKDCVNIDCEECYINMIKKMSLQIKNELQ